MSKSAKALTQKFNLTSFLSRLAVCPEPLKNQLYRFLEFIRRYCCSSQKCRYVDARQTISSAIKLGVSVPDYLEITWDQVGARYEVFDEMKKRRIFEHSFESICEIGTGAGIFLDLTLECTKARLYQSYEPDREWSSWLSDTYGIQSCSSDGKTLSQSLTGSVDLLLSHGVFVYLPFLVSCGYYYEISRVTRSGAFILFDVLTEDCFDKISLQKWLSSPHIYPVITPKQFLVNQMRELGMSLVDEFFNNYHGASKSHYFLFRKQ